MKREKWPAKKINNTQICSAHFAMRREKWPAKKINNAQICSAHFATDKPSQFSKA